VCTLGYSFARWLISDTVISKASGQKNLVDTKCQDYSENFQKDEPKREHLK
jgi:hypothetical protein